MKALLDHKEQVIFGADFSKVSQIFKNSEIYLKNERLIKQPTFLIELIF